MVYKLSQIYFYQLNNSYSLQEIGL